MKKLILISIITLFALIIFAQEQENFEIKMGGYLVWNDTEATSTFEPLDTVLPGDEILFVLSYTNDTKQIITDFYISALIPEGTTYIPESATGDGRLENEFEDIDETMEVELFFSIDDGESFMQPPLFVEEEVGGITVRKLATIDQYTNIKWFINKEILEEETINLIYKVKVSNQ